MSVTVAIEKCTTTTGEGPHWDEKTQSLYYVDILNGGVHCWNSLTGQDRSIHLDGNVGFVIPTTKGDLVIGLDRKLCRLNFETKEVTPIVEIDGEIPNNRFNDGKCDPVGRLYAGSMAMETAPTILEREKGSLFSFDKEGKATTQVTKVSISNGLAWSLDQKTMYYIDSIPRQVFAFDYDATTGSLANRRVCIDLSKTQVTGLPDGMCIDNEGKLWVACYLGAKVVRFDPDTGEKLREIDIPGLRTTSCCWGGPNYDELYVTCGITSATEEEMTKYPLGGSVFKVTGLGVKGSPPSVYDG